MLRQVPGLYLLLGPDRPDESFRRVGPFAVKGHGLLFSEAEDDRVLVFMDGLFLRDAPSGGEDARTALTSFRRSGLAGITDQEGFYNLLLIEKDREVAHLISDAVATRPWSVYQRGGRVAAAPTPVTFAELGLPMTFNRRAAFETIRLSYTVTHSTLIDEVRRNRPCIRFEISPEGAVREERFRDLVHQPDLGLSREDMADMIHGIIQDGVSAIVNHPRLKDRPIHLPLTGGLDSRHILGELMVQGRPPTLLRHVNIQEMDCRPVKTMAQGLGLPLNLKEMTEVDHRRLAFQWAERSGGFANFHQYYLLEMVTDVPAGGVVGFDGYCMDFLLSLQTKTDLNKTGLAVDTVWNRKYTTEFSLSRMFPDHRTLTREARAQMEEEAEEYQGNQWFKMGMMDLYHRSPKYTGSAYCLMGDEAEYFAPGALLRSIDFFCKANPEESLDTRARLVLMKKYFPELSAFPGKYGIPFTEYDFLIEEYPSKWKYAFWLLRGWATFMRIDPMPEGEHYWLRRIPMLRDMHRRVVRESELAADGLISKAGLELSLAQLRLGLYEGWTLMSVLTVEGAYRMLVKRQSPEDFIDWLCGRQRPR